MRLCFTEIAQVVHGNLRNHTEPFSERKKARQHVMSAGSIDFSGIESKRQKKKPLPLSWRKGSGCPAFWSEKQFIALANETSFYVSISANLGKRSGAGNRKHDVQSAPPFCPDWDRSV
jgi:hypothetical protein